MKKKFISILMLTFLSNCNSLAMKPSWTPEDLDKKMTMRMRDTVMAALGATDPRNSVKLKVLDHAAALGRPYHPGCGLTVAAQDLNCAIEKTESAQIIKMPENVDKYYIVTRIKINFDENSKKLMSALKEEYKDCFVKKLEKTIECNSENIKSYDDSCMNFKRIFDLYEKIQRRKCDIEVLSATKRFDAPVRDEMRNNGLPYCDGEEWFLDLGKESVKCGKEEFLKMEKKKEIFFDETCQNWTRFIDSSDKKYDDCSTTVKLNCVPSCQNYCCVTVRNNQTSELVFEQTQGFNLP